MKRPEAHSPGAIFLKIINRVESRLTTAKRPRSFKDAALANDLRGELFKLEGWAKIHRTWPHKKERKVFEQLRADSKTLEDALGALDLARQMASDLRRKEHPEFARLFDEQEERARHQLKHILKSKQWLAMDQESRTEKMRHWILAIDWPSKTEQTDFLLRALLKELNDLSTRYREELKPQLLKTSYTRKVLDNDMHKFRRQLRWFSMYAQTADGLIQLGPVSEPLTAEQKKLLSTYKNSDFAKLPTKKIAHAKLDAISFYELTRLVELLGTAKDQAERYFYLRDVLKARGEKASRATEVAKSVYGDAPVEAAKSTHAIMAEYERLKPLRDLAESLSNNRVNR